MAYQAPIAKKIPHVHDMHGHQRIDKYHWMTNRDTPEVIDYLKEENEYYEASTKHTDNFKKDLFEEIKSRIKEDDESVPYLLNGYWYMSKMETGESYPYYYRRKEGSDNKELLFNVNLMAVGHDFYSLTSMNISPDNKLVAYGVDTKGRREYTIFIKNLETGETFENHLELTTGGSVWANDNKTLFFTRKD
ncbi:MAG: oligopeptidase B, partial [Nonlabens sp.]